MLVQTLSGCAATAALTALLSLTPAQAAMLPMSHFDLPGVQKVDCAAGFHIGPIGTCIIGTEEEHHDQVVEHPVDGGCQTKSVQRSDAMGNSETRTKTDCD
jgi:hypothetical protein